MVKRMPDRRVRKSVKADQRQEEEEFSFLNIHAWKMSHCKEISDDLVVNSTP